MTWSGGAAWLRGIVPGPTAWTRLARPWRDAVASFTEKAFADWHIPGPRSTLRCCRFISRRHDGPQGRFRFWKLTHSLSDEDFGVAEYLAAMRAVYLLACWDCFDLPNLAAVENTLRRRQMFEYVYLMDRGHAASESAGSAHGKNDRKRARDCGGGRPTLLSFAFINEGAALAGQSRDCGESMISPLLLEHVAREVERDASVLKQARKAREEQRASEP